MSFLAYIPPFIILIVVLVFVHELGHFLAAKWCKVRATVFAIGMGPRLFGWNKITGFKFGKIDENLDLGDDTDYRVCALPLGGYVKIEGMVDESLDENFSDKPVQPWEFRSKNYFQKLLIMSAGVIMNLLLAMVIFIGINIHSGKILSNTNQIGDIPKEGIAYKLGFKPFDKILKVDDFSITHFEEINEKIYLSKSGEDKTISVQRGDSVFSLTVPAKEILASQSGSNPEILFPVSAQTFLTIEGVVENTPAEKAGLKAGDIINSVDKIDIYGAEKFRTYLHDNPGKQVTLGITRDDNAKLIDITPRTDNTIGVQISDKFHGATTKIDYGFFEAVKVSFSQIGTICEQLVFMLKKLFSGEAKLKDSVGGPVAIAKQAKQWFSLGLIPFLSGMAFLSVTLAFMNILPFPVLDGGHILILTIEKIIRRELPIRTKMIIQQAGMIIMLLFTLFVVYNDITKR